MENTLIEAQSIPQEKRIEFIFQSFDSLKMGDSITIINNHDPEKLLNKFKEYRPSQFTAEYLATGPVEWKLMLTKKKIEGGCGCC